MSGETKGFAYYIQGRTKILFRRYTQPYVQGKISETEGFVIDLDVLDIADGVGDHPRSAKVRGEVFGDNKR